MNHVFKHVFNQCNYNAAQTRYREGGNERSFLWGVYVAEHKQYKERGVNTLFCGGYMLFNIYGTGKGGVMMNSSFASSRGEK